MNNRTYASRAEHAGAKARGPDRRDARAAQQPRYASINANGYVPALELDDGALLAAPAAIVQYLVVDPRPNLGLQPPAGSWRG